MDKLFRRQNTRTKLTAAGLLAGLILPCTELCLTGNRDMQAYNESVTPINGSRDTTDFLEEELKALLTDLGVPVHNIPIDFVERVRRWTRLYQTRDRRDIERVLASRCHDFEAVRQQLTNANLPPDLAFVTLVESHFQADAMSPHGNAGLWQFTQGTARRNGLKVNAAIDERFDPRKSSEAACRYLLRLRDQQGREGSLMLALAAYNMGPGRLNQRTEQLNDLSKRHDFWHLYRTRPLPALTRTVLARLMAAILIGRHPLYFGFKTAAPGNLETVSSTVSHF